MLYLQPKPVTITLFFSMALLCGCNDYSKEKEKAAAKAADDTSISDEKAIALVAQKCVPLHVGTAIVLPNKKQGGFTVGVTPETLITTFVGTYRRAEGN